MRKQMIVVSFQPHLALIFVTHLDEEGEEGARNSY